MPHKLPDPPGLILTGPLTFEPVEVIERRPVKPAVLEFSMPIPSGMTWSEFRAWMIRDIRR